MGVSYKALTCYPIFLTSSERCLLVDYLKPFQSSILRKIDFSNSYPENVPNYNEICFSYNALPLQGHLVLKGFFQSEKYFDKELVRHLFEIDKETEIYICKKYGHVLKQNPVAIHVRRGDYLKCEYIHPVCRMSYFNKAIACFGSETSFLVISDDIKWCKNILKAILFILRIANLHWSTCIYSLCAHTILSVIQPLVGGEPG